MKKVLGTLAIAAVLVAAFPMTASAGNVKPGCGGIFFRPCPATRPGPGSTGNPNGTRSGGGSSTGTGTGNGTSRGAGNGRALPMPPVGR